MYQPMHPVSCIGYITMLHAHPSKGYPFSFSLQITKMRNYCGLCETASASSTTRNRNQKASEVLHLVREAQRTGAIPKHVQNPRIWQSVVPSAPFPYAINKQCSSPQNQIGTLSFLQVGPCQLLPQTPNPQHQIL